MNDDLGLILVIEDDAQTRRYLRQCLAGRGWRVAEADCGKAGLATAKAETPDLAVVDLGLPDLDGVAVVRALRLWSDLPILILSARSQEADKIEALDAGADDYLTKPFGTGELDARLRALQRRAGAAAGSGSAFESDDLRVDLNLRQVFRDGAEVKLTPIEYRILAMLIRQAGRVVTQRQLLTEIWGADHLYDSHYLRIYMGQLRHKLEADPARPRHFLTEVGVGYRLV